MISPSANLRAAERQFPPDPGLLRSCPYSQQVVCAQLVTSRKIGAQIGARMGPKQRVGSG
jgi:hypothetical protein